jgi:hypothetical protein
VTASILGFGYQRKCRRYRSVFSARATGRSTQLEIHTGQSRKQNDLFLGLEGQRGSGVRFRITQGHRYILTDHRLAPLTRSPRYAHVIAL